MATKQQTATMQELSISTEELALISSSLKSVIEKFKVH
jgi:methyl-accepting chemotaxis protein